MPLPPAGARTATKQTAGGFRSATIFSGVTSPSIVAAPGAVVAGYDVLLWSGAGRLDTVLTHQHILAANGFVAGGPTLSGVAFSSPVVFYDAAAPVTGGPVYASGHRVIAFIPAYNSVFSGVTTPLSGTAPGFPVTWGTPVNIGAPFVSGLCVSTRSGAGFTVTWTAEQNPQ